MAAKSKSSNPVSMDLFSKFPNRFELAMALAKRAKQLKEGVKPLVEYNDKEEIRAIDVALEEIIADEVKITVHEDTVDEDDYLDEMDQLLDAELAEEDDKDDKKKEGKGRSKKSLAA